MIICNLMRDTKTKYETLGWLTIGSKKWPTIERVWTPSENSPAGKRSASCVPLGDYKLVPHSGDKFSRVWALVNTTLDIYHWPWEIPKTKEPFARSVCLLHPANYAVELEGCVAPGLKRIYDQMSGRWYVRSSRDAINEIRSALGSSIDVKLTISEAS
jgi:hypothetical protein